MIATVYSTFSGKLAGKHPTLGVWVREDGLVKRPKFGGGKCTIFIWRKGSYRGKYLRVAIKGKGYSVHRLVAETFIPRPDGKTAVDHINRDTSDNRIENLRWATASENARNTVTFMNAADFGVRECEDKKAYIRAYSKAYYHRMKSDPDFVNKIRERNRIAMRKRRAKKKAEQSAQPS